jgi:hypothetical protein
MREKAVAFERRGVVVRECWKRWMKKNAERVAWVEACKQSEAYSAKIREQRTLQQRQQQLQAKQNGVVAIVNGTSKALTTTNQDRKRRMEVTPQKKRARRRVQTGEIQHPIVDEDIARRFKEVRALSIYFFFLLIRGGWESDYVSFSSCLLPSIHPPLFAVKQNREDSERLWAKGSYLQVYTQLLAAKRQSTASNLKSSLNSSFNSNSRSLILSSSRNQLQQTQPALLPATWEIWLSTNPVHDPTAIWLDTKFGVPESGSWLSENVFSIALEKESVSGKTHPGVVVFECSPVEGVDDELERYAILSVFHSISDTQAIAYVYRKYRVLDDCARLRDIVKSFPGRRYYVPSILFIAHVHNAEPYGELFSMVSALSLPFRICVLDGYS